MCIRDRIGFEPTNRFRVLPYHSTIYLCDPAGRNRSSCDAYIGVYSTTLLDCRGEGGIRTPVSVT
jgi:hypothetical protein